MKIISSKNYKRFQYLIHETDCLESIRQKYCNKLREDQFLIATLKKENEELQKKLDKA